MSKDDLFQQVTNIKHKEDASRRRDLAEVTNEECLDCEAEIRKSIFQDVRQWLTQHGLSGRQLLKWVNKRLEGLG